MTAKKKFILTITFLLGLFVPLIWLTLEYIFEWMPLTTFKLYIVGFFWPLYIHNISISLLEGWQNIIFGYAMLLGFNMVIYAFIGWLIWCAKTKHKFYYLLAPAPLIFLWYLLSFPLHNIVYLNS